ncbi:MAG: archease [Rubrobacteraceae bacterium]|nr:archease [Rubrobacteraceae bacterium]
MIRILDHTADVGFEAAAESPEGLFLEAMRGVLLLMFERPPQGGGCLRTVELEGPDLEVLLVRWLSELLYLVQEEGFVPADGSLRLDMEDCSLRARLRGSALDVEEQGWIGEIKSVTFHGLEIRQEGDTWSCRVIFDV